MGLESSYQRGPGCLTHMHNSYKHIHNSYMFQHQFVLWCSGLVQNASGGKMSPKVESASPWLRCRSCVSAGHSYVLLRVRIQAR